MKPDKPFRKHAFWKDGEVGYKTLHQWVRRYKPVPEFCVKCEVNPPKEVANVSGKYLRDLNDYEWLCVSCHRKKDGQTDKFIAWRRENNPPAYWTGKKHTEEWKKRNMEMARIMVKKRQRNERGQFI